MAKRTTEEQLKAKTDNKGRPVSFIEGTLEFVTEEMAAEQPGLSHLKGKQIVARHCDATDEVYPVATSDLHQTFYAPAERPNQRKIKAAAKRGAKKAQTEADAAELKELRA